MSTAVRSLKPSLPTVAARSAQTRKSENPRPNQARRSAEPRPVDRVSLTEAPESESESKSRGGFDTSALMANYSPAGKSATKSATADPLMPDDPEQEQAITGQVPEGYEPAYAQDGVTVYQNASGETISQKETTEEGVTTVETTIDDTTHKYSEQTLADGSTQRTHTVIENGQTQEVTDVIRPDGTIERTSTDTSPSDKSFEELSGASGQGLPESGRDPAQVTTTKSVVIDPSTEPPTETLVSEGQSITQSAPISEAELAPGMTVDPSSSQITRSQASVTTYGPDGQPIATETSQGVVTDVTARREDGSEVSISNSNLTGPDGTQVVNQQHTGFTRGELESATTWNAQVGDEVVSLVPEPGSVSGESASHHFSEALDGDFASWAGADSSTTPIDVSTTTTITPDGEKTEQMDIGDLSGDGRMVSRIDGPDGVTWVQKETTNGGQRVAQQATMEGNPDYRSETLTEYGEGDDVKVTTQVWAGDTLAHESTLDHHQLRTQAELDAYIDKQVGEGKPSPEEQAAFDRMRDELQAGAPVYVDDATDQRFDHSDSPDDIGSWKTTSTSLSAPESGVIVSRSGEKLDANGQYQPPGWGDYHDGFIYKESGAVVNPGGEPPLSGYVQYGLKGDAATGELIRVDSTYDAIDGAKTYSFQVQSDGSVTTDYTGEGAADDPLADYYMEIDKLAHPGLTSSSSSIDVLTGAMSPVSTLTGLTSDVVETGAKIAEKELSKIPSTVVGSVGILVGSTQLYHGLNEGDAFKAAGGASLAGSGAYGVASNFAAEGSSVLLLGKVLGAAGGGASIASGIIHLSEGDTTKAVLDMSAGAAMVGAAMATGPLAGAFLAGAAVMTLGSLAYDWAHSGDPADIDETRPINGEPLFVG